MRPRRAWPAGIASGLRRRVAARIRVTITTGTDSGDGPADDGRLDLRTVCLAVGAWASAWVLVQRDAGVSIVVTVLGAVLMAALFRSLLRNRGLVAWAHHWWSPLASACVGSFMIAAAISMHALSERDPTLGALADASSTIRVEARVLADPTPLAAATPPRGESVVGPADRPGASATAPAPRTSLLIEVSLQRYAAGGNWHASAAEAVLVIGDVQLPGNQQLAPGQHLAGLARISRADPGQRAGYWLRAAGGLRVLPPGGRAPATSAWRQRLVDFSRNLPGDGRSLLPGMVMGDRSGQPQELSGAMKAAGLAHLTAVSGANVAMVLGAVLWLSRLCGAGRSVALLLSLLCLVGYVVLVHPEPSVIRAAVMGAVGALAVFAGRGRQALAALCVCIGAVLAWDPWFAVEPAFQLSALATAGIVLMGQRLARLGRWVMPGWLADGVAISLSAQLFCLPVLLGLNPSFALYSVPANIAVAPLVPLVTVAGTSALVLCSVPGPWALPLIWLAGIPASWVGWIGRLVAGLPGALLPWPEGLWGRSASVLLAVLAMVAAWLATTAAPAPSPFRTERRGVRPGAGNPMRRLVGVGRSWRRKGAAATVAMAAVGLLAGLTAPATALLPVSPGQWQVAACDVGQGDAFALRTGTESAVLVDTGPDPALSDACLASLGVKRLDALFITHLHADHAGGVAGVVHGRSLGNVYFSTGTGRSDIPGLPEDAQPQRLAAGATGAAGPVSWRVIAPVTDPRGEEENNASLVMVFTVAPGEGPGFTLLETGDIEAEAMAGLLRSNPGLTVDVLKVSHHGAKNGGEAIIRSCGARVGLIGVGTGNTYGHPAPSTMHALEAAGITAYRTDLNGTVRLRSTADGRFVLTGRKDAGVGG